MAFKMNPALKAYGKSAGSNRVMKMNKPMKMDKAMKMDPSAMKKDLPEVTVTGKKTVRRVKKVLSPGYSKNSSGDLVYKGNIIPKSEASKISESELYTKKTVGSSTVPMQKNGNDDAKMKALKARLDKAMKEGNDREISAIRSELQQLYKAEKKAPTTEAKPA